MPAAFRRLCVETKKIRNSFPYPPPAAFRRLCVETGGILEIVDIGDQPPSGGCVLKLLIDEAEQLPTRPAAVRRLCVETSCRICIR